MSKILIIKIKACKDCPYCDYDEYYSYCNKLQTPLFTPHAIDIACPLSDDEED